MSSGSVDPVPDSGPSLPSHGGNAASSSQTAATLEVVTKPLPDVSSVARDLEKLQAEVARGTSPARKRPRTGVHGFVTPPLDSVVNKVAEGLAQPLEGRRGEKRGRSPSPGAGIVAVQEIRDDSPLRQSKKDKKQRKDKDRKKKSKKHKKSRKHRRRSSSSSRSSSSDSSDSSVFRVASVSGGAASQLRLIAWAKRHPGKLAQKGLQAMQNVIGREGEELEPSRRAAPPCAKAYFLRLLEPKCAKGGVRNLREIETLCHILDHLAMGRFCEAMDVVFQRLTALEKATTDQGWNEAKFLELVSDQKVFYHLAFFLVCSPLSQTKKVSSFLFRPEVREVRGVIVDHVWQLLGSRRRCAARIWNTLRKKKWNSRGSWPEARNPTTPIGIPTRKRGKARETNGTNGNHTTPSQTTRGMARGRKTVHGANAGDESKVPSPEFAA